MHLNYQSSGYIWLYAWTLIPGSWLKLGSSMETSIRSTSKMETYISVKVLINMSGIIIIQNFTIFLSIQIIDKE
jgi:hypothetical protein